MKIERLHMMGFGALRGEMSFAGEGCNLILAPNESGKSTLVAALLTALYGLPDERRSRNRPITRRDAYRPWDGGPYGLQASFTVAGRGFSGVDHTIRLWPIPEGEPLHTLRHDALIEQLSSLTNIRIVEDARTPDGFAPEVLPFPGWETVPTW